MQKDRIIGHNDHGEPIVRSEGEIKMRWVMMQVIAGMSAKIFALRAEVAELRKTD